MAYNPHMTGYVVESPKQPKQPSPFFIAQVGGFLEE